MTTKLCMTLQVFYFAWVGYAQWYNASPPCDGARIAAVLAMTPEQLTNTPI